MTTNQPNPEQRSMGRYPIDFFPLTPDSDRRFYKNIFQELHCPLEWDNLAETELFTDCDQRTLDTVVRYLTGEGNDRLTCTTHLAECIKLHQFLHCNGPDYCKTFENLNKDYLLSLKCPDVTAVCKGKGKTRRIT